MNRYMRIALTLVVIEHCASNVRCSLPDINITYQAQFCLYVRMLNCSVITGRTNFKFGTIDHCLGVGVIRGFLTLS